MNKKRFLIFMISVLLLSLFVGCQKNDPVIAPPQTDPSDTSSKPEEVTTLPPDYSQMKVISTGKVLTADIGMMAAEYKNSSPYTIQVRLLPNGVHLYGYSEGSAVIELTDYFGHTAKITATVSENSESIAVDVEKCKDKFIEVGQFGAIGNGYKDDTKAFQKAIDSASPGDTVYVYPGRYNVSLISMREGVTLRLYSEMTNAKDGYTDKISADINDQKYAILSGTRILNTNNEAKGTTGASNFSIIGGVIDSNCKNVSVALFACADNFRLENVIFKDLKSGHTLQIMGCKNSVIKNCMFAGFVCGDSYSKETIQIEPARPNATGGPITFEEGEYYYSENISISDCYFGKSDEAGPHVVAIGDHCSVGGVTVRNFRITNNFFDECMYASIRYNNLSDVEISGNTFLSTAEYKTPNIFIGVHQPAFIHLYSSNNNNKYIASNGESITETEASEQSGLHNINIKNNVFTLEEGSDKRIIYYNTQKYTPGVSFLTLKRQDHFNTPTYDFSGYSVNTNFIDGLSFTDNTINVNGQPAYFNYCFKIINAYNLEFANNKLNLNNDASFSYDNGEYLTSTDLTKKFDFVINTKKTDKTITINFDGRSYPISASFSGNITLRKEAGGIIKAYTDKEGNLTVDIIPADGYSPSKIHFYSGNDLRTDQNKITSSTTINIYFTKN
ncbi:MAG: hypothetical protein E7601_04850 [Ruminococcaceae bacterium]|nr:hypothetical protein [Oscillospiraceae bacterium]